MSDVHLRKVREFMEAAGQVVADEPSQPDRQTATLRARLIMEEALEMIDALGVDLSLRKEVSGETEYLPVSMDDLHFEHVVPVHMLKMVDAACDIHYVVLGTLVAAGLPFDRFMDEVCDNNLTKVKPTVHLDENGKVKKPPGYKPPDLSSILLSLYTPKG